MDPPQAPGEILLANGGLQLARYTSAAATAIYLYNIPLTMDVEVEHIWSRLSFDLPTLLYMVNRYICLGFFLVATFTVAGFHKDFSDAYCRIPVDLIGTGIAYTGWTGIMTLRVCAIWGQKRILVWIVLILWIGVIAAMTVLLYLSYREVGATFVYNTSARLCTPTGTPSIFSAISIAPVIYELFLTILTVIKVFEFGAYPSVTTIPTLYRVIVRDGVLYFVIGTTISIINTVAWYTLPHQDMHLLFSLYLAIMSTLMARLVLNLRIAHQQSIREQLGSEGVTGNTSNHPSKAESDEQSRDVASLHATASIPLNSMKTFWSNSIDDAEIT